MTTPLSHDVPRRTDEEGAVYDDLRYQRFKRNLRLEQKRLNEEIRSRTYVARIFPNEVVPAALAKGRGQTAQLD